MLSDSQKQKRREARKRWRDKHPDYNKEYKLRNMDRCKKIEQEWRQDHKQEKRAYDQSYREANRDKIKHRKRSYHAHRSSVHKRVYDDEIGVWICQFCGAREGEIQLDVHHVNQDRSNNNPSNLVCLCKNCHQKLHQRWSTEVIPSLIDKGIVDWQGNILVSTGNTENNKINY